MTTVEVKGLTMEQRKILRDAGHETERLDFTHTNVNCEDKWLDDLTDLLNSWEKEWRLV